MLGAALVAACRQPLKQEKFVPGWKRAALYPACMDPTNSPNPQYIRLNLTLGGTGRERERYAANLKDDFLSLRPTPPPPSHETYLVPPLRES